jgi:hypothetical protein
MVLRLAGLWLIYVTWCQVSGWLLSGVGSLNITGYLATAPVALGLAVWFWSANRPATTTRLSFSKWLRRIKASPSLMAWCGVTLLILTGALINPPSNYDGLTYRLPKLLYWLQENRWHWIDGLDFRLNITGAGFEWLSAPFILFTRSDRGLFLLNFLPFLLLPGLFFVAARGLGIRLRAARWWMWVWPMAYGITMQAGSIGNDMAAAALALASLAFAAQALRGRPCLCLFLSALAAAAMTGIKATTLPLGLPLGIFWLWVAYQSIGWRKTLTLGTALLPLAILVSFLPVAIACSMHTGRWNGNPGDRYGFEPKNPIAALAGNSMDFSFSLFALPLAPGSGGINARFDHWLSGKSWNTWIKANYSCFNPSLLQDMPTEEGAGIGLGITLAALTWAAKRPTRRGTRPPSGTAIGLVFSLATFVGLLAFMAKSGVGGTPRLMVPFTPLLLLAVICWRSRRALPVRTRHALLSVIPAVFLIPALFLNPNRPLLPASLLTHLPGLPESVRARMAQVYQAYSMRGELLAPFREKIPAGELVGFAGGGDNSAYALFKPFGTRHVTNLSLRTLDSVQWILATRDGFERRLGMPLEQWEPASGFTKVYQKTIVSRVSTGPEDWLLYRKAPPTSPSSAGG